MREKKINSIEDQNSFILLFELFKVLNKKRKKQVFLSFFVIILASISEIMTIYLILPFTSLLLDGKGNYSDNLLSKFLFSVKAMIKAKKV